MNAKIILWAASASLVLALVALGAVYGFRPGADPQAGARDTVGAFVAALEARNFGEACELYGDNLLNGSATTTVNGVHLDDLRACAVGFEMAEAFSLNFGATFYDRFRVATTLVTDQTTPRNGYVFKVNYANGTIYVGAQRDDGGSWRIVSVTE